MTAELIESLECERAAAHSRIDELYDSLIAKTNTHLMNIRELVAMGKNPDMYVNATFTQVLMCFDMQGQEWKEYFGINSRIPIFVDRRKCLVALLLNEGINLKQVADLLGYKDHSTVINLRDGHYDLLVTEPNYRKTYNELLKNLCSVKDVEPKNSG